ncbi:TetR family transcriptional regulator [Rhodococcus sp. 06-412-2C]|uniref:TetR/AcrR family transcriptional regulator n=1 Tax=unclassified Rhodococcus (in: high G+C Gram-positive bacteria) TaxID=192944 RepID=UPI000B9A54FE|nr:MULTISPECIES: TetR/AcrR family transcriptional regulator [unclassified Rhodococcus (in: high G+C Gram-positive bacteria)]OZC86064.1 TetR family transcriptional regulator [Rhodococcus sp. 06-412-2C]OZC99850.1 TetR family transcriptional regulator [Rhodococcus sp. 06-412-2B]
MPAAPESDGDLPNRELPITPRGLRTRSSLVAAARRVFEESGYLDSRLIDITRAARCSAGTFYTYFTSKEEILAAVLEQARDDMLHPGTERVDPHENPVAVIAASNRAYFEAYQRNAKLMALLEQVSNIDPEFRRLRRERADAFVRRNARSIEGLQNRGLADTELDPLLASRALSSMISRLAFNHFVVDAAGGRAAADYERLLETATRLWVNALRLPFTDEGDAERELDA